MNRLSRYLLIWLLPMAAVRGEDQPTWAVSEAVNKLIAEKASFAPGRDGFVKRSDGSLAQYERPEKFFTKDGKNWQVEILSRRWRITRDAKWEEWMDARPKYAAWRIAVIRVDVLASGVNAKWVVGDNFADGSAPSAAEIHKGLSTPGGRGVGIPADEAKAVKPPQADRPSPPVAPAVKAVPGPGSGIFKRKADGSMEKVNP